MQTIESAILVLKYFNLFCNLVLFLSIIPRFFHKRDRKGCAEHGNISWSSFWEIKINPRQARNKKRLQNRPSIDMPHNRKPTDKKRMIADLFHKICHHRLTPPVLSSNRRGSY